MPPRPYSKVALTTDQQVALLESRGLVIANRVHACEVLGRINYYRLSAYWHPFKRGDDTYAPGSTFEAAVELYEFDRRLRLLALDGIERVEVHVRTRLAYSLSVACGPFAHEDPSFFNPTFDHARFVADLHKEALRASEDFIAHYKATYTGFPRLPVWIAVEVASFGGLSKMYEYVEAPRRIEVAREFGIHETVLKSWLHALSRVRNVCAHHGRLWNRFWGIPPKRPKKTSFANLAIAPDERRSYFMLLILRALTKDHHAGDDWARAAIALLSELDAHPWRRNSIGMPADWKTHDFWMV